MAAQGDIPDAICPIGRCALDVAPLGSSLWVVWSDGGLVRADWSEAGATWPLQEAHPDVLERPLPDAYAPILAYLVDGAVDLSELAVDLVGTPFQLRVWSALRAIAPGRLRTYAGLAADIDSPRATRAVGMANARNPLPVIIPCHRVVQTGHLLGGYSGGLDRKRYLLAHEGARVEGDQVRPGQLTLL